MTESDKIAMVQALVDDAGASSDLVQKYLDIAGNKILNRMYPFGIEEGKSVPGCYQFLQCELASRLFLRRGAEGEIAHNENGLSRTYGSVDDSDLLSQVMQVAKLY